MLTPLTTFPCPRKPPDHALEHLVRTHAHRHGARRFQPGAGEAAREHGQIGKPYGRGRLDVVGRVAHDPCMPRMTKPLYGDRKNVGRWFRGLDSGRRHQFVDSIVAAQQRKIALNVGALAR